MTIPAGQQKGQNVRYAGDDIKQDALVFAARTKFCVPPSWA